MSKHIIYPKEEKLFIKYSHLDELEIRFNLFDIERYSLFYYYGESYLYHINKKTKCVHVNYDLIWNKLKNELKLDFLGLNFLLNEMVKKHFGLKGYSVI